MTGRSYGHYCPVAKTLDLVGGRWTLLIVRELLVGPQRFTDLHAALEGIPRNLLADRLRHLEAHGVVTRQELPPPAARTVYELTGPGQELLPIIGALARWGLTHLPPPEPGEPVNPSLGVLAERHGLPLPAAVRRPTRKVRRP
jgi:DNA-binding HxlR family transcriptional regulator